MCNDMKTIIQLASSSPDGEFDLMTYRQRARKTSSLRISIRQRPPPPQESCIEYMLKNP